ncbi:MAG: alginate export family protein, partial [Nitrospinaceae bacterium]
AEDNKRKTESGVSRDLTWIFIDNLFESNFSLQIGRQDFVESREWWWDEDLDGIRLYYNTYNWYAQIGIAQELAVEKTLERQIDPEEDKVLRFIGQAGWNWTSGNRLEFFFLHQLDGSKTENLGVILDEEDEDESDADLTWLGLRAIGKTRRSSIGQFKYWVDTGMVWGRESFLDFSGVGETQSRVKSRLERDVMGWGLDTGLSWSLPVRLRPAFTLSYAWGSGESNEEAEKDHAFRQTGLQDNNNRYGGVDRFRYYGELFRPELANLQILTGAFGFSFFQNSSVEFLYHNYRQVKAAPFQRDIRIKASPSGTDKDIGNEFDVVIGLEEWKHVEIELVSGVFWAGDAFEKRSGKRVYNFSFKFNYNF